MFVFKLLGIGPVTSFLASCLDAPSQDAVQQTLNFLRRIQAITPINTEEPDPRSSQQKNRTKSMRRDLRLYAQNAKNAANAHQPIPEPNKAHISESCGEEDNDVLTPLGTHLANLPLDPQCAKLLILGALFHCLEPALAVAACLSFRDPFEVPLDKQAESDQRRLELTENTLSDHWVYYTALQVIYVVY